MTPLYLDHAATTPMRPESREALIDALDEFGGNPAGTHGVARAAKNALEDARERAASMLGAGRPDEIVFTSGGTESDNLALMGTVAASARSSVLTSEIEHKAVSETAEALARRGSRWVTVPCDADGAVAPADVAEATSDDIAIVSVMAANNEVGTVSPIGEISAAVQAVDDAVVVHSDAVQAFVGDDVTVSSTGADLISLSAHKFGGPKGVGLLYVRTGVALEATVHGGGQEAGRRSGTSNVPGVVAMVAAMEATVADRQRFTEVVGGERDAFEHTLVERIPDAVVNAASAIRLPQFSHVALPGRLAETMLIHLDRAGISASAGSACQSGAVESSHVLRAMGYADDVARSCLRFTFGWPTGEGDGPKAADAVADAIGAV